jgi:hypothetical protein
MARRVTAALAAMALVAGALMAAALMAAALPGTARASAPPTPWDGTNPFNCTVQDAGLGPTGPDPGADPYCVHFDKTHQNVTQLGIADFISQEPARTAAAVPKCFYFQEDHWRGSLAQSDGTAAYEFEGHYFFNKATGDGGVWITGFTLAGQTFDPATLPGFPAQYGGYFGAGTGGVITHDDVPADPRCVALAQRNPAAVYGQATAPRCLPGAGSVTRRGLGPIALGATEAALRAELGSPAQVDRGFLRYCVAGGGRLAAGEPGDRSGTLGSDPGARAVLVLTTARGFLLSGHRHRTLTVGARRRALRRAFPHARALGRVGAVRLFGAGRRRGIVAAMRHGRVAYLAVYDPHRIHGRRALARYLKRSA